MWLTLDLPGTLLGAGHGSVPLSCQRVQGALSHPDCAAALVELFVEPDRILAFVLTSGDTQPRMVEWPCPPARLRYLLTTYYRELVEYPRHGTGQVWQELASPLMQSVLPALQGADLVYLIPHDQLAYFPLHALRARDCPLIEKFPVVYAPSAHLLTLTLERSAAAGETTKLESILVAGNPTFDLGQAEDEARWVAGYFGVHPYLGKEATKIKIRSELAGKDLVHLACHGFFRPYEPLESGLLMAGKRTLNVQDIKAVQMRADLVTLSSCDSALVDPYEPGEPTGLAVAFLESGTASVLGTLWPVLDTTTKLLMSTFYPRLYDRTGNKISTKAKALQQAMLAVREQKQHPYYWAGFTLTGAWR